MNSVCRDIEAKNKLASNTGMSRHHDLDLAILLLLAHFQRLYINTYFFIFRGGPSIGGQRNKPLGFLTLGQSSWRKKIEEGEDYFIFSYASLVVFLHLMF